MTPTPTRPSDLAINEADRVVATVSVAFRVEHGASVASLSPETIEVDLTDLVRQRSESLALQMMPMRIEQAASDLARPILKRAGLDSAEEGRGS